jgi:hypothetical protein
LSSTPGASLGCYGLELVENRAFRSLITVASLGQLGDGGAHRREFRDLAIDRSDMLKGEALHLATADLTRVASLRSAT